MTSIPITSIQVEQRGRRDPGDITPLAESIEDLGLLNPIIVMELSQGHYLLLAGHRRLVAAQSLGWTEIPATILQGLSLRDQLQVELHDNQFTLPLDWSESATQTRRIMTTSRRSKLLSEEALLDSYQPHPSRFLDTTMPNFDFCEVSVDCGSLFLNDLHAKANQGAWVLCWTSTPEQTITQLEVAGWDKPLVGYWTQSQTVRDALQDPTKVHKFVYASKPPARVAKPNRPKVYQFPSASKSVKLMRSLILTFVGEGRFVFAPHSTTGITLIAAWLCGCPALGWGSTPELFEEAIYENLHIHPGRGHQAGSSR